MPKVRHRCKRCHRTDDVVGRISRKGLCPDCGTAAYLEAQRALVERSGPVYDAYVEGWLRSAGRAGRPITPHPPDA